MVEVEDCSKTWSASQGCDFAERSTASKLKLIMTTITMIIVTSLNIKTFKVEYLFKF